MNKFVCNVCGYVHETELEFDNIPDDFVCPVCGVSKSDFSAQL